MPEKKDASKTESNALLDDIDLDELIETTNLDILPKYEAIDKDDLTTIRKVVIHSLPKFSYVEKVGKDLRFMVISENGVKFSLPADSIALRRSLISLAIKECKATTKEAIDMSKVIGKMYGIKRERFEAKGFTQAPYKFFNLEK